MVRKTAGKMQQSQTFECQHLLLSAINKHSDGDDIARK